MEGYDDQDVSLRGKWCRIFPLEDNISEMTLWGVFTDLEVETIATELIGLIVDLKVP